MKETRMKYFSLYMPRIERKSTLEELYLKIFHKAKYYKYMRTLAKQRIEDRLFFKLMSKAVNSDEFYKGRDFKEVWKGL